MFAKLLESRFLATLALALVGLPAGAASNAPVQAPATPARQVNIGWVGLSRPWSFLLSGRYVVTPENPSPLTLIDRRQKTTAPNPIEHASQAVEFMGTEVPASSASPPEDLLSKRLVFAPWPAGGDDKINMVILPTMPNSSPNPFMAAPKDFNVGDYLPWPLNTPPGMFPTPSRQQLDWYDEQLRKSLAPDVFVIGGHHVISQGYHDDAELSFIFQPSLFWAVENDRAARAYFDHVKVAILFGCNTLTNLEPHRADGSAMEPDEIRKLYESGPQGRQAVLGTAAATNTLEFYKSRLAKEYGPRSHKYQYTRNAAKEQCDPSSPTSWCPVSNLERIMPDSGLFDGSRRYNEALKARELFRNAYLVIGFSSASPSEEKRVLYLQRAVRMATKELGLSGKNAMDLIVGDQTPEPLRKRAIISLRRAWERVTFLANRQRPSGSITPRYPDIDRGYVMELRQTNDPQLNAKYM